MGGFIASLIIIFVVGVILDLGARGGAYDLTDFKVAFTVQYVFWAFGLVSLLRSRRLTRAGMAAEGTTVDPLAAARSRTVTVTRRRGTGRE